MEGLTVAKKMTTLRHLSVATFDWPDTKDQARIERNQFLYGDEIIEALRFCKHNDGRHVRVHLVITEEHWLGLFMSAVENGVFSPSALHAMSGMLRELGEPDDRE
jgi:hypothetical protein